MKIDGIHHISAITADAPGNVAFYVRVLGLRLVKKTVNQDDPGVYHLFYADDGGSPGADLTFFEYPGARRGRVGAGMVHRVTWRVPDVAAIDFWEERLTGAGAAPRREGAALRFRDPEGLHLELVVDDSGDAPLRATASGVPEEHAICGFAGVRAYTHDAGETQAMLGEVLGMEQAADGDWIARGASRGSWYGVDPAPDAPGEMGAGVVHHVAFTVSQETYDAWNERIASTGMPSSGKVDRFYFRSIYVREPGGVLIELATDGPGFAVDEPAGELGERLSLPPEFEPMRTDIERNLTPLPTLR